MVDMVDTCRLKPTTPIAASKFEVQLYLEVPRDVVLLLETLMTFRGSQDFPRHSSSSSSHLLSLKKMHSVRMKSSDSECCQVPLRPGCLSCRFRRSFLYLIRGLICIGSTVEDGVSGSCGCTVKIPSVEYAAKSSHLLRTLFCEIHHIANPSIKFKAPHVPPPAQ